VEGILLDCVGDKLESGSDYRFVRSEDILNSHLKICSSISVPRRSSHHDDEDDNDEDDLLMDACSDQKGSGLVMCLTRIRRHVSLSLSLSLVLFMDFVGIAMFLLFEAAYLASVHAVDFL
jgi:hypothetical protein